MGPGDSKNDTLGVGPGARAGILRFQSLRPGSLFAGRFEILDTLGGGGGGEVFRAHDRLLSQDVAVKVLFPGTSDRDVERLRREVRSARSLQHPNILRVHDLGEHDGLFYIVSEVLEGESLAQRLAREGPLPPSEAEHVLRCILEALACAHEASIIHRDVKPANVFLASAEAGVPPRVVLLDFGLARPISGATVTIAGHFVGTPEYCAPEQIRGDRGLGPAVDLYGCGVTLWEMLAGAPPYHGASDVETLRQHLEDSIPRPAAALAGAPLRLQSLAVDLLQKDPARRPSDAREALRRLDRHVWLGTRLRIEWRARTGRTGVRRKLAVRGAAALVFLAVIGAIGIFLATPTKVRVEGHDLIWQTRLGFSWRSKPFAQDLLRAVLTRSGWRPLPAAIVSAETYDPERGRVLLADGSHARSLYRVDYPFSSAVPFWTDARREQSLLEYARYPFSSPTYVLERLALMPWTPPGSDGAIALTLANVPNYPSRAVEVDTEGNFRSVYDHPGRLFEPLGVPGHGGRPDLLLFGSINNLLGPREAVVALRAEDGGWGQAPPYTGSVKVKDTCYWYLPLQFVLRKEMSVTTDGARGVALLADGIRVEFDLDRGVPLDPAVRGGLTAEAWIERRDSLMKSLFEATALAEAGDPAGGARLLETFAMKSAGPPWTVSIPAYRAAILRMRAARSPVELGQALSDIEQAFAAEPEPPRYGLLHAEILGRMGRASEASRLLRTWWTRPSQEFYSFEWLLLRWLAGEDPSTEILMAAKPVLICGDWRLTIDAASGLRAGQPEAVLALLDSPHAPASCWRSQWYLGARAAMAARQPSLERVEDFLDRADKALLTGYPVPLRLARVRARLEIAPFPHVTSEDIEAALADFTRLVEHSRFNLEALYLLSFAIEDAERFRDAGMAPKALSPLIDEARAMLAPVGDRWGPRGQLSR